MSRSLHTQRLENRAPRRLARPYATRKKEAEVLCGRGRQEQPLSVVPHRRLIHLQKPLPGTICPLSSHDIQCLLETLGSTATYGLRSIRLVGVSMFTKEGLLFGEYLLTGEIRLYTTPVLPWRLPFLLAPQDHVSLLRYGAKISVEARLPQTHIDWTLDGLKSFYLCAVLAHELGHHRLQYARGKRNVMRCRRKDHEQCADLHGSRFGRRLQQGEGAY